MSSILSFLPIENRIFAYPFLYRPEANIADCVIENPEECIPIYR